jgi:hypothetical protein
LHFEQRKAGVGSGFGGGMDTIEGLEESFITMSMLTRTSSRKLRINSVT